MRVVERIARQHIARQIDDPELREKVTPDYTIGCKRILPSNRWYRALAKPNVELVTERRERGARALDRRRRRRPSARSTRSSSAPASRSPTSRPPSASAAAAASCSTTSGTAARAPTSAPRSPGFPNLFFLLGPNTGLGHSSMVYMIESQIAHVMAALRHMRERGAETIEVRPEAQERYNAELERRHRGHGVEHRLRELVPRRHRPQRHALARLDVALPPPRRAAATPPSTRSTSRRRARARWRHEPRVLITGAAGGIGAAAARELRARGAQRRRARPRAPATTSSRATCATRRRSTARWRRRSSGSAGSTC